MREARTGVLRPSQCVQWFFVASGDNLPRLQKKVPKVNERHSLLFIEGDSDPFERSLMDLLHYG